MWVMSASATQQVGQEIPLGVSRTDAVETAVNLPASPDTCPLEGRALTFSSPVPVAVSAGSLEQSNEVGITDGDAHSDDRVPSINMNEMFDISAWLTFGKPRRAENAALKRSM